MISASLRYFVSHAERGNEKTYYVLGSSFPRSAWECRPGRSRVLQRETLTLDAERRTLHSHAERGNEKKIKVKIMGVFRFLIRVIRQISDSRLLINHISRPIKINGNQARYASFLHSHTDQLFSYFHGHLIMRNNNKLHTF